MENEKEILRKQMKLIAEDSVAATGDELANLSVAMCKIDQRLVRRHLSLTSTKRFIMFTQFLMCFILSMSLCLKYGKDK